jgi:hypothetical protein
MERKGSQNSIKDLSIQNLMIARFNLFLSSLSLLLDSNAIILYFTKVLTYIFFFFILNKTREGRGHVLVTFTRL